jgi:hypothetical protein
MGLKNGKHVKLIRHLSSICFGIKKSFYVGNRTLKNLFGHGKEFLEDNSVDLY